jgi:hypothetical protein
MSTLRSNLTEIAHRFADSVLDAIRSSSLEELLADGGSRGGRHANGGGVSPPR